MIPQIPDIKDIIQLLKDDPDDPNWTVKEQQAVYKALQALTFHWFRVEVPYIRKGK